MRYLSELHKRSSTYTAAFAAVVSVLLGLAGATVLAEPPETKPSDATTSTRAKPHVLHLFKWHEIEYRELGSESGRRELGVTQQQVAQLKTIAAEFQRRYRQAIAEMDWSSTPREEMEAAYAAKRSKILADTRQQIEKVLGPEKFERIEASRLRRLTQMFISRPVGTHVDLGLTDEQEVKIEVICREDFAARYHLVRQGQERLLAVLTAEQAEKLRQRFERQKPTRSYLFSPLPDYPELTDENVQKELEFTQEQVQQFDAIREALQKQQKTLTDEKKRGPAEPADSSKLSKMERREREAASTKRYREKYRRLLQEAREKIRDLLTPQQVEGLQKIRFRRRAGRTMEFYARQTSRGSAEVPVKLSEEQYARIREHCEETVAEQRQLQAEAAENVLDVLTLQQIEELRKKGWSARRTSGMRPLNRPK